MKSAIYTTRVTFLQLSTKQYNDSLFKVELEKSFVLNENFACYTFLCKARRTIKVLEIINNRYLYIFFSSNIVETRRILPFMRVESLLNNGGIIGNTDFS